jgi:4-hydroxythreonine-4-phosphate dehydrogenase
VNYKPILINSGEPYSVFLEIFFKAFAQEKFKRPIILVVSKKLLIAQMKFLKFNLKMKIIDVKDINFKELSLKEINIIDIDLSFDKPFGTISNKTNIYLEKSFNVCLQLLKTKKFIGFINGPISKANFLKEKFLGITEYLASKTKTKNVAMLIYNSKLSVSPITTHLPLKDVYKKITMKKIISHFILINNFYKKNFKKIPKIAITGLNPHCESNYKSSEEEKIIKPAIKYLKSKKYKIAGPFPADTIFMEFNSKKYDVIIGMYHDQVLTPLKTMFEFDAINITIGMPFIRISPDHGPNSSMLGKNKSNPQSLINAIKFLDK